MRCVCVRPYAEIAPAALEKGRWGNSHLASVSATSHLTSHIHTCRATAEARYRCKDGKFYVQVSRNPLWRSTLGWWRSGWSHSKETRPMLDGPFSR